MDRRAERAALDELLDAVRAGQSRALLVRGEPGVGKTALLEYLAGRASGCRVVREAAGVQSELELAFAGAASGVRADAGSAGGSAGAAG
jgi:ABC-type transport system involved in cytochrome c biogenesis ATPase subunit